MLVARLQIRRGLGNQSSEVLRHSFSVFDVSLNTECVQHVQRKFVYQVVATADCDNNIVCAALPNILLPGCHPPLVVVLNQDYQGVFWNPGPVHYDRGSGLIYSDDGFHAIVPSTGLPRGSSRWGVGGQWRRTQP